MATYLKTPEEQRKALLRTLGNLPIGACEGLFQHLLDRGAPATLRVRALLSGIQGHWNDDDRQVLGAVMGFPEDCVLDEGAVAEDVPAPAAFVGSILLRNQETRQARVVPHALGSMVVLLLANPPEYRPVGELSRALGVSAVLLRTRINRLSAFLAQEGIRILLQNVRGRGYRFDPDVLGRKFTFEVVAASASAPEPEADPA